MAIERVQINIRSDSEEKARYSEAAAADPTTPDLTAWVKKNCDKAYERYIKQKNKGKKV